MGSLVCKTLFCLPLGAQKCEIDGAIGIFRHYCVFVLRFFKQAVTKVFKAKLLCNCHFICAMVRKHKRIAVEKVFVTGKLSKGVIKLTIAKVLQRDHWKIKRNVTTSQRRQKRVQPQL